MTLDLRAAVLFFAMAALFLGSGSERLPKHQSHSQAEKTIAVTVKKAQGRVSYEVESKAVNDPFGPLVKLLRQRGEDCPVIVILPWDATFREEYDVRVIASKAGFKTIRSFLYNRDRGFMAEVKWGPSIPFSTNPPVE